MTAYLRLLSSYLKCYFLSSFHVVIPSLPGYFKSTLPQTVNWDNRKVAAVFHHLMKDVLGYTTYACQGGDWVCIFLRPLGSPVFNQIVEIHREVWFFVSSARSTPSPSSFSTSTFFLETPGSSKVEVSIPMIQVKLPFAEKPFWLLE